MEIKLIFYPFLLIFFFMNFICPLYAEELVVIKSLSKSKKTFAIRKGFKDGIYQGQISLFSTDKASIAARVIEISRYYSVWEMQQVHASFPFLKGQIVNYTNSIEEIWSNVGMMKYLALKKEVEFKQLKKSDHYTRFILAGSFSNTLSENISEIDDYQTPKRQAFSFEGLYTVKIDEVYEVGAGLRYDNEVATRENPNITIPSTRYFAEAIILKNFSLDPITANRFYLAALLGYGQSSTNVIEEIKKGPSLLFPAIKAGRKFNSTGDYSFFTEIALEHILSYERFDDDYLQTTRIIASRFSIGVAF